MYEEGRQADRQADRQTDRQTDTATVTWRLYSRARGLKLAPQKYYLALERIWIFLFLFIFCLRLSAWWSARSIS